MVFEHIEKLKRAFTDKYVVVDATRPELARFANAIGLIKTVNMSGRALVEFDQYDNIGWYDIELDFLKVVPQPEPKLAEAKKEAAGKAATQKGTEKVTAPAASAGQVAAAKAAAKPAAPAAGKPSTADILAAARVKKRTGEPVAGTQAAPAAKTAPAAAPKVASPAAKPAPDGKLSTTDVLAMARGKGAAPAPAASAAAAAKPVAKATVKPDEPAPITPEEAEEPVAEAAPVVEPAKPIKKAAGGPKPTTTAEKIAYCRQVDGNG
ncbi:MAG TPA: hypothetical protein VFE46_12435 [Pirellulales bacterium]|jgi:hypothetical protein|nr:hypothetical protein [Pirellulales bacterium]